MRQLHRDELAIDPVDAAKLLLGCVLEVSTDDGTVGVRLTEVEAYRGADDPASHCYRGKTPRNEVMFGPAGHLYVYFVYGMHFCANVVSLTDGVPGAVLLRAGDVVSGLDVAKARRPAARSVNELAKGPARLTSVLGLRRDHNGADLTAPDATVRLYAGDPVDDETVHSGPRVGVALAKDVPWRFWLNGAPSVSAYRRGAKRRR
ncbi:DNA-3-methyladenine glycosylase [Herbihabitans rhizosphaerae]|uniref:Putative 3-methyladenine DNA glycosylase n=1 Tax=Herbihabitans rhizosphaerae TaxID=1872711 RepID=A0A4Q7KET6_9PSEU|nr:DNA-3-methyladenine glycosylase [Herbihabitans rhizosphaerae]RZS29750.1 DNA-3-methyladenine glycosylase [Herbihabitans rhizosphaerae]